MLKTVKKAIHQIETSYLKKERMKLYPLLDEFQLEWKTEDILTFQELWYKGFSLKWIADVLGRDIDELTVVVIDQARQGYIPCRDRGIYTSSEIMMNKHIKMRIHQLKKHDKDEVALLIIDRARKGCIEPRPSGLKGVKILEECS